MLAGARSWFLLLFVLLALLFAGHVPAYSQVNGVPASVTSIGFGGKSGPNGVPPSVTSLGPKGYPNTWPVYGVGGCCANFFLPANPTVNGHTHHRRNRDKDPALAVGVVEPVYVPYGVPYAQDADDDNAPDVDYVHAPLAANVGVPGMPSAGMPNGAMPNAGPSSPRVRNRDGNATLDDSGKSAFVGPIREEPEDPVVAQPATVLVFKDGHRSEVLNYAVVEDTLFDFGEDRTHKIPLSDLDLPATRKANDDRGVDFQVPANTARK
jgi:hypothetical protein